MRDKQLADNIFPLTHILKVPPQHFFAQNQRNYVKIVLPRGER